MKKHIYIIMCITVVLAATAKAQVRSGYFIEGYTMAHEMNPAIQPDYSYITVPVLGGTQVGVSSTIGMGDILFEKNGGKLTTFMSKGTIDKNTLLDKVGNGVNISTNARINLFGIGLRVTDNEYRTLAISLRTEGAGFLSKDLFDCLKDIENKNYQIENTGIKASTYLEIAAGQSQKVNEIFSMGAKAKLLVGLMNANIQIDNIELNTNSETTWTANGHATMDVSGLKYKTEIKDYDNKQGRYEQIKDVRLGKFGIHGIGLAIDAGVDLTPNDHWKFSAAIIDLGFVTWIKSRKAENAGKPFSFNGFQDIAVEKSDDNSLKNQWNDLHDDLMDLIHLEDKGNHIFTKMLGATINVGALYHIDKYRIGMLFNSRIDDKYSWWETRINAMAKPFAKTNLEFCISPNYSTFGLGVGGMINYVSNSGFNIYLASDRLFTTVNPQMIPTSLNGAVQIGAAIRIK